MSRSRWPAALSAAAGLVLSLLGALAACGDPSAGEAGHRGAAPPPTHPLASEGTRRMAQRLWEMPQQLDPLDSEYRNVERAAIWAERVATAGGPGQAPTRAVLSWARELLLAGHPEQAIPIFESMQATLASRANAEMLAELRHMLGLAWMRLAEQQNCLQHHTLDSCLVPIQGDGLHQLAEGGNKAMALFREALEHDSQDWEARWLLNLAAMTVGEWPQGVPEAWLMPPEVFASEAPFPRFPDVAAAAGVNTVSLAGGVCMEDFDGDGLLDLLVSSWGLDDPLHLYQNQGDGRFADRSEDSRLAGIVGGLNLVHADADNDGDADVFVLRGAWVEKGGGYPNSYLRNEGQLVFSDATEESGLLSFHSTQAGNFGDYDGDGWLDLFVGNETGPHETHPCELFHNEGGTFRDVAPAQQMDLVGYVKAAVWGDIENDGDLDLYVSRIDGRNWLMRNDGPLPGGLPPRAMTPAVPERGSALPAVPWLFTDVAAEAGVQEPVRSFPAWFFDADNDGWQDIFVAGYRWGSSGLVAKDYLDLPSKGIRARLYHNRHDGTFADVSEQAGLARVLPTMGSNFGDLDNDGCLDLYCGTGEPDFAALYPNRMFLNDGRGAFLDVTTAGGFGHVQKGHAIAFGDLDADGDQDIYAVMGGAYSGDVFPNALFRNPGFGRHWLTLRLEGVEANRSAIGARVRVRIAEPQDPAQPDGSRRERDLHLVVNTGGSFGSSSLQQEIGLGQALAVLELEVQWPGSGRVQHFEDVPFDRVLELREGGTLQPASAAGTPVGILR